MFGDWGLRIVDLESRDESPIPNPQIPNPQLKNIKIRRKFEDQ